MGVRKFKENRTVLRRQKTSNALELELLKNVRLSLSGEKVQFSLIRPGPIVRQNNN